MLSESARSTSAAQSRYRVQAPNSAARNMLVVALDPASRDLGGLFLKQAWQGVTFVGFAEPGERFHDGNWRNAAAASSADVVMMLATPGHRLDVAREIGSFAVERGIKVASILVLQGAAGDQVAESLQQLRPWTRTLTILNDETYLADFLQALGG